MALSMLELRRKAQQLNRIRTSVADYGTIKRLIGELMEDVRTVIGTTPGGELYFRAQRLPFKPTELMHLGAPPAELVTDYQRCNIPHEPVLYTASRRVTALRELHVTAGEMIYLSQWIGNEGLPINKMFHGAEDDPNIKDVFRDRDFLVHSLLESLFTRPIHRTFSHEYKITAAVSERLMSTAHPEAQFNIKDDCLVGMRYPSVVDLAGSYNTVLPASFLYDRMHFMNCMQIHINAFDGVDVDFTVEDSAAFIADRKIKWVGDASAVPELRDADRGAKFIYTEDGLSVLTAKDPIMPEFLRALVEE